MNGPCVVVLLRLIMWTFAVVKVAAARTVKELCTYVTLVSKD